MRGFLFLLRNGYLGILLHGLAKPPKNERISNVTIWPYSQIINTQPSEQPQTYYILPQFECG